MMKIKYFLLVTILIAITSCENENNIKDIPQENSENYESPEKKFKILDFDAGAYENYLKQTDNKVGFHSLKPFKDREHSTIKDVFLSNGNQPIISLNGKKLISDPTSTSKISEFSNDEIYGKTIKFGFKKTENSKEAENSNKEMYIPKKLNILKPLPLENDIFIYAFYKDFKLEWNADPINEEGLMVAVMYDGSNVIPENDENVIIKNIDHIELDNGEFTLNNAMFENIPNHALVDIMLLRGNVQIEEFNDESYKLFAESHQTISLVLIKDMSSIERND